MGSSSVSSIARPPEAGQLRGAARPFRGCRATPWRGLTHTRLWLLVGLCLAPASVHAHLASVCTSTAMSTCSHYNRLVFFLGTYHEPWIPAGSTPSLITASGPIASPMRTAHTSWRRRAQRKPRALTRLLAPPLCVNRGIHPAAQRCGGGCLRVRLYRQLHLLPRLAKQRPGRALRQLRRLHTTREQSSVPGRVDEGQRDRIASDYEGLSRHCDRERFVCDLLQAQ